MSIPLGLKLTRAKLDDPNERQAFQELSSDYFLWMNQQISGLCGFSIPDIVGHNLEDYVAFTVGISCNIGPEEGGIYFIRNDKGGADAMGGLRRLPDGAAEIVRIFTRPELRGSGLGSSMVRGLVSEAKRLKYREIRLDTGVFMKDAQRIYAAAGFVFCDAYAGAEPPDALQPFWLYLKQSLE